MFPSHAKMYLAPIRTQTSAKKREEFEDSCVGWDEFADETLQNYGVDMRSLTETFEQEQREFFLNTSAWVDVHPSQVLGAPCVLRDFDLHTVTLEEMRNLDVPFNLRVMEAAGRRARRRLARFADGSTSASRAARPIPTRRTSSSPPRRTRTAPRTGVSRRSTSIPPFPPRTGTSSPVGSSSSARRRTSACTICVSRGSRARTRGGLSWPTRQSASSATCGTSSDGRVYRRCDSTCVMRLFSSFSRRVFLSFALVCRRTSRRQYQMGPSTTFAIAAASASSSSSSSP